MKRHILMTLWVVVLILSFFFWVYGIGSRLYLTAMAPDPVQALFHLDSSIRISAIQQGYGEYVFWRTVSSLFDGRFVITEVILLTGLISAVVSCRQQRKKKMDWHHDYAALQKRVTELEGLL